MKTHRLEKECPFRPSITRTGGKARGGSVRHKGRGPGELLRETHNLIKQRINEQKQENSFAPKTVRGSKLTREELDEIALNKVKSLFISSNSDPEERRQYIKERANQVIRKAKIRLYKRVFGALDEDGDGYISSTDIKSDSNPLHNTRIARRYIE